MTSHWKRTWGATCLSTVAGLLAFSAGMASSEDVAGDWVGLLNGQFHVVVHVTRVGAGPYQATLESPDQGSFVLPVDSIVTDPDHFSFTVPKIGANYAGVWDGDKKAWVGKVDSRGVPAAQPDADDGPGGRSGAA